MNDLVLHIVVPIISAVIGWFSANYMTKRQKNKDDLKMVNDATQSMLSTINGTLTRIDELTQKITTLQTENLQLKAERVQLNMKIDTLTRKVDEMQQVISRLAKQKGVKEQKPTKKQNNE